MTDTVNQIKEVALKELADEQFREQVETEKDRLREARKYWFPWKITLTIKRRE